MWHIVTSLEGLIFTKCPQPSLVYISWYYEIDVLTYKIAALLIFTDFATVAIPNLVK